MIAAARRSTLSAQLAEQVIARDSGVARVVREAPGALEGLHQQIAALADRVARDRTAELTTPPDEVVEDGRPLRALATPDRRTP